MADHIDCHYRFCVPIASFSCSGHLGLDAAFRPLTPAQHPPFSQCESKRTATLSSSPTRAFVLAILMAARLILLPMLLGCASAASASTERETFLADLAEAQDFSAALSLSSIRRAERYRESLASGRLTVGPTVHTPYGDLIGVTGGNVSQFLGVPFAAPPVGPLRWRSPQPPQPWATPRPAQWFGPTCPQTEANTWAIFTGTSEDCLNLNVYAPSAPPPAGGYPIMVFFYGGSFTYGSAGFPLCVS